MNTPTHFRQRLDAELRERAAQLSAKSAPTPARRFRPPRRMLMVAATAAAAVAVTVAVPLSTGGGTDAAYAVTPHPDGTVTIQAFGSNGIAAFQAALSKLGIRTVVVVTTPGCTTQLPADRTQLHKVLVGVVPQGGLPAMVIRPSAMPPGDTLVFAVTHTKTYLEMGDGKRVLTGQTGTASQMGVVHTVPSCIADISAFNVEIHSSSAPPTRVPVSK